jgi:hypothetical protein
MKTHYWSGHIGVVLVLGSYMLSEEIVYYKGNTTGLIRDQLNRTEADARMSMPECKCRNANAGMPMPD